MKNSLIMFTLFCSALGLGLAIHFAGKPQPSFGNTRPGQSSGSLPARTARVVQPNLVMESAEADFSFTWQDVESEDYKIYIANLRSIGVPEQTVRDIILAEIEKLFKPREAPFKPSRVNELSRASEANAAAEFEKRKQLRLVQLEKRALIKELLGIHLPLAVLPSTYPRNYEQYENALAALPESKREAVQFLKEAYWQQSDALKDKHDNKRTPEYYAEYQTLNAQHNAELGKILTPAESEEFEMRSSTMASRLAGEIAGLNPSEEEFRKLFRLTRDYETTMGRVGNQFTGAAVDPETRQTASREREEQLRSVLGDDRYAEYQRLQDGNYRTFTVLTERFELPAGTAQQAYELTQTFQKQMAQVRANASTPADKRARAIQNAELGKALKSSLSQLLGERAAKAYERHENGFPVPGSEY